MSEITTSQIVSHLHPRPSSDLADHPIPTGKEEVWRFTPMDRMAPLLDADADWGEPVIEIEGVGDGAWVAATQPAKPESTDGETLVPVDRPSAIARARVRKTYTLHLDMPDQDPVVFSVEGTGSSQAVRLTIRIAPGNRGIVVLRHTGSGAFIGNVEIVVGDGADLTVVSLQEWDDDALHAGFHQARVGRDAHYRHVAATFGGSLVRLQNSVAYDGPGGVAELYGLHVTDAHQHHEHRLFVDQNQPNTTSRVDYRGALQGKGARSVWVGDVLIRRQATGVDSYESNRNLLLTPGTVAESVPNLEIETGEIIGAGHSTATGRFDDEQLFYLQSRGIPEDEARRLILQGFLFDIIRRIGVPQIEARLQAAVDTELDITAIEEN